MYNKGGHDIGISYFIIDVRNLMKKIEFNEKKNIVSKIIKDNRIKNSLSQSELSAKMQGMGIKIDQQMISKIETNSRIVTDYELASFCLILQIDANEMVKDFYNDYVK